ncbi:NUDIX hydrolase [Priestia megaterium]|nr:NUDIX hydrolase [Priestia megaterium]
MDQELIQIFNSEKQKLGVATRKEVHQKGYWHEAFHCWFVSEEDRNFYIYFQKRSPLKKEYPNLFDITAAGHLLAHETVQDGVREIEEELGITLSFQDLIPLGELKYSIKKANYIDNEFAHVYVYKSTHTFEDFLLQEEEVSGIIKAKFDDFYRLWLGKLETLMINGFEINNSGQKQQVTKLVNKHHFAPHQPFYYKYILEAIKQLLSKP